MRAMRRKPLGDHRPHPVPRFDPRDLRAARIK
jgi:hypothetical protein